MIALLKGQIDRIQNDSIIIDVNGVGYLVHVPISTRDEAILHEKTTLHITTVVREDAITLYGFSSTGQRETFETLRSVNKIGPKLALTILGHLDIDQLGAAIQRGDIVTLSKIPGIGKRTAERMCLELKDKLAAFGDIQPLQPGQAATRKTRQDPLRLALAQLDYRKTEIDMVINSGEVPKLDDAPIEERLRAALRFLAKQN
jgi:Holliday junction DNA helicase RuvA